MPIATRWDDKPASRAKLLCGPQDAVSSQRRIKVDQSTVLAQNSSDGSTENIAASAGRNPRPVRLTGATVGHGHAMAHHGEILQGVFPDRYGVTRRGLVTLPCPALGTNATFFPDAKSESRIHPCPQWCAKAARAAEITLKHYAPCAPSGGELVLDSSIQPGIGMGSSTSDVVAAIRTVADCYGLPLTVADVARLAVAAEGASDSIMMGDRVVLFAQREGRVLEFIGYDPIPLLVISCDTDPTGKGIDTLKHPAATYSDVEEREFKVLLGALRHAVSTGDAVLLGRVASASARINQRYTPKSRLNELFGIADETGAVGVQVAHSGTVVGLLFDARDSTAHNRVKRCQQTLEQEGFAHCWTFDTRGII
jgi:uncharacterized protein involved in propanediol utilization